VKVAPLPYIVDVNPPPSSRRLTPQENPGTRRAAFWIVTLILPIAILGATEGILRMVRYGGKLDLVIRKTVDGKEWCPDHP